MAVMAGAVATAGPTGNVELISKGNTPTPVTDRGIHSAISGNGRYVAFYSAGRDLDPTDTNSAEDVFLRDRQTGNLERISKAYTGLSTNGSSSVWRGAVNGDGTVIAFTSTASNLIDHDNNKVSDVFVRDTTTGQNELISIDKHDSDASLKSYDASVSPDGRYVVFTSAADDLVAVDNNNHEDVFLRDRQSGVTTILSTRPDGSPADGQSGQGAISADGTKVAFASRADDIVAGDGNGKADIFVRDLASGAIERVSVSNTGAGGNADSTWPTISGDGRYVAFQTVASNLGGVKYNNGNDLDVYIRDTQSDRTSRVMPDLASAAQWGDGTAWEVHQGTVLNPSITNDGRYLAFHTNSSDFGLAANGNILVLDRETGDYSLVSSSPDGTAGGGPSILPQFAGDGSALTFASRSQSLLPIGSTYNNQIFARGFSADSVPADIDGDGVANIDDNCPKVSNAGQADYDQEGRGDDCDFDDDSDLLVDPLEPRQGTDKRDEDSDGDGVGDEADDYPTDPNRAEGTEHRTLNKHTFNTSDGTVLMTLKYNSENNTFEGRLTGRLAADTKYSLITYRRSRYIREREVCTIQTNVSGLVSCAQGGLTLPFFTHVALVKNGDAGLDPYASHEYADGADRDKTILPGN